MESRKLIKLGKNSHVVSLPNHWIKKNKLEKGSRIYLEEKGKNLSLLPSIKEYKKEETQTEINVDGKDINWIRREIIASYLHNFTIIKLQGDSLKDKVQKIRKIIQELLALEIIEITQKRIVVKDYLDLGKTEIDQLVRKVDLILRSMFFDVNFESETKTHNNLIYRDKDLNRLYFVVLKYIQDLLKNEGVKKCITNYKLFNTWYLLYHLESIGDKLKNISNYYRNIKDKKERQKLKKLHKDVTEYYLDTIKAYYKEDKEKAYKLSEMKNKFTNISEKIYNQVKSKWAIRVVALQLAIIRKIHNILREVYNRQ